MKNVKREIATISEISLGLVRSQNVYWLCVLIEPVQPIVVKVMLVR